MYHLCILILVSVLTTLLQFWLSLKQLPLPFPQSRQQFKFKYLHNRQFYFMWHTRDRTWFGCVWFGAFFLNSFPFLVRGCASEKYVQLAYIIGKLSWVSLPICHKPEPNRYQLQEKAGRSISVTDSIFGFSFDSANQFQM